MYPIVCWCHRLTSYYKSFTNMVTKSTLLYVLFKAIQRPLIFEDKLISRIDPYPIFHTWLDEARKNQPIIEMVLSTVSSEGKPSSRCVLFSRLHEGGLMFFTDSQSRKAQEFIGNPNVCTVFHFPNSNRQIRVEGVIEQLPHEVAAESFYSRSREIQLTLLLGNQSKPVSDKATLHKMRQEIASKYPDPSIPLPVPTDWAAYIIKPNYFEFYQGEPHYLADRDTFTKQSDGTWSPQCLMP